MKTVWSSKLHGKKEENVLEFMGRAEDDLPLLKYEVAATKAHAHVLCEMGFLSEEEARAIESALDELPSNVTPEGEDIHSFIELYLTDKLGDTGKKIHALRSRNDLISMDIRLFVRDKLTSILDSLDGLVKMLHDKAGSLMQECPGFTHLQPAMPFTAGGYLEVFAESLEDDVLLGKALLRAVSKSTLGSGAGFGFPLDIPKEKYAKLLGLEGPVKSPLYAVVSRPKIEKLYLHWLSTVADSIEKFCSTLIFLVHERIFTLPEFAVTGSSIMPQKRNPDLYEVLRGKAKQVKGAFLTAYLIDTNLGVGYFRDFQESKKALFSATELIELSIQMLEKLVPELDANEKKVPETYAVYEALELVKQGVPWRDAYKRVAERMKGKC